MYTLSAETEKLAYYVLQNGRSEVTSADVKNVSIAEISSDTFALANAIISGRGDEALRALGVMKFRRVEPVIVMGELSGTICDMIKVKALLKEGLSASAIASILSTPGHNFSEYKAKRMMAGVKDAPEEKLYRALALCSDADLALKHSSSDYSDIEKFICCI
jgi:DNA polymerase III delta subunit